MQENILNANLTFTDDFSDDLRDLIRKLLNRDPNKRLGTGMNGTYDIQRHPWFKDIDWNHLYRKEVESPFKPHCCDPTDVKYVDEEILNERVSMLEMKKGKRSIMIEEDAFAGFSYDGESQMIKYFKSKMMMMKDEERINERDIEEEDDDVVERDRDEEDDDDDEKRFNGKFKKREGMKIITSLNRKSSSPNIIISSEGVKDIIEDVKITKKQNDSNDLIFSLD